MTQTEKEYCPATLKAVNIAQRLNAGGFSTRVLNNTISINECKFSMSENHKHIEKDALHYFFPADINEDAACQVISSLAKYNFEKRIANDIMDMVLSLGVSRANKGYIYLMEAIEICVKDYDKVFSIIKEVYSEIAQKHNATACQVERGIRTAINNAFEENPDAVRKLFKRPIISPTNSEIIAEIADTVIRKYR